jgi:hypothetical protein
MVTLLRLGIIPQLHIFTLLQSHNPEKDPTPSTHCAKVALVLGSMIRVAECFSITNQAAVNAQ